MTADHEASAAALEATGRYRVLRRLEPRTRYADPDDAAALHRALIVDVETSGLNPRTDEVIELAMLSFLFSSDGRVFDVGHAFEGLRQPARPIPAEITAVTGIRDEDVAGRSFSAGEVAAFASGASLAIAHSAAFDRPFVERLCPEFSRLPWACSIEEVDWKAEGSPSSRLEWLLLRHGLYYDAHRALADCRALLELLARPLRDGRPALAQLLDNARQPTHRVWATNAHFDRKDELKARNYRWNPGEDGRPKAWYRDVRGDEVLAAELAWLADGRICRGEPLVDHFTARDRYREGWR